MKRDNELLREMLFEFEASTDYLIMDRLTLGMSKEDRIWQYHLELLSDQGFVTPVGKSTYRITSQGHDFLEAIRSETVWTKTKEGAAKIGGATLGMMKDLAIAYMKQEAAEKLGIKL